MANMAMPDWKLEEICEMTIDRFGLVNEDVFNTIMREMPDSIRSNPQRFRSKLDERTAVHKENQIGYFTTAISTLAHECGGIERVKAAGLNAFTKIIAELFDEVPRAVCQAAFKHGNRTINHEVIWLLDSPVVFIYRKMYRRKFMNLAVATWKFYTQYEGDAEMQAQGMKVLCEHWDNHMRSEDKLKLRLPGIGELPTRLPGSMPRAED